MNFLAHVYFSFHDEHLLVGNILTDLLSLKEVRVLASPYQEGVLLHRVIDHTTDQHTVHRKNLKIFYPLQGKYTPVAMDIYYDYFLSKHWSTFERIDLRAVCDHSYDVLLRHREAYPETTGHLIKRMVDDDFLFSCITFERMHKTFERLLKRVKFESNLNHAVRDLMEKEEEIESHFLEFFQDARNTIMAINPKPR